MNNMEQTLSIIKPDAVERNLIENIKSIFTKNNLTIKEDKKFIDKNGNSSSFSNLVLPIKKSYWKKLKDWNIRPFQKLL